MKNWVERKRDGEINRERDAEMDREREMGK